MEKAARKVIGGLVDLHGKSLTEKPEGFIDKDEVPHAWHYLVNPGSSITGRCMIEGNSLTVLHNGEAAYLVDAATSADIAAVTEKIEVLGGKVALAMKKLED